MVIAHRAGFTQEVNVPLICETVLRDAAVAVAAAHDADVDMYQLKVIH